MAQRVDQLVVLRPQRSMMIFFRSGPKFRVRLKHERLFSVVFQQNSGSGIVDTPDRPTIDGGADFVCLRTYRQNAKSR